MTLAPRLACSGVTVRFGGLIAVNDVALDVPAGSIVGLVGPNGAGKSTLFGVLSGLLKPNSGTVLLDGEDITSATPQERAAKGLARTFQHPEIFTDLTVRQNLVLAYRARHQKARVWSDLFTFGSMRPSDAAERATVDELITLLGLDQVADSPALGLPLGVSRLVELGRALSTSPSAVLLDEPSSGLDSSETDQFEATLRKAVAERDLSVLLVEHDVELVMRLCSSINVLDFGSLIARGTPEEVSSNRKVKAAYLGEEVTGPQAAVSVSSPQVAANGSGQREAALQAEGLSVRYGEALALSDVSFTVHTGEALAILGPNGAGKSSLARALSGLVPLAAGTIVFDAQRIDGWAAHRIRKAGIVHLPEGRGVFRTMSVMENLRMAAAAVPGRQARRAGVETALEIFPALADRRRQTAALLSGGEQQMLSLARALATSPRLLIADEMSLGLAPRMVDVVFEGLARAKESGVTVIMVEQYVHRALAFADECLVLHRGSVAWTGPASEAGTELLSNYLGTASVGRE
jgi:branched-chain amino acid transport system ATP-binding protein